MIELNVGYLASSPRILATMQTMRMANWINKKKSKICDDEFIFIGIDSKNKLRLHIVINNYQTSWLEALYKIASRGWHVEILQIVS